MPLQNETQKMGEKLQVEMCPSITEKKFEQGFTVPNTIMCFGIWRIMISLTSLTESNSSNRYLNRLIIYARWMCCRSLSNASIVGTLPPAIGNLTNLLEL